MKTAAPRARVRTVRGRPAIARTPVRRRVVETPAAYRTKAEVAADAIRSAILSGDLAPGEELTVLALAQRFGLTLMPLREALSRLHAEGLVEMESHRPARVANMSRERLEEEYFVRSIVEAAAAAQATPHIDAETFEDLEATLRRMDAARDARRTADYWELTRKFHELIYSKAPSELLRKEVDRLRARTRRYLQVFSLDNNLVPEAQREHWEILRALKKGDAHGVERLLRQHIVHVAKLVRVP